MLHWYVSNNNIFLGDSDVGKNSEVIGDSIPLETITEETIQRGQGNAVILRNGIERKCVKDEKIDDTDEEEREEGDEGNDHEDVDAIDDQEDSLGKWK